MKLSKRFAALGLSLVMVLALAACGDDAADATPTPGGSNTDAPASAKSFQFYGKFDEGDGANASMLNAAFLLNLNEDGTAVASLSHYSKGGVLSFFHSHIAGLRLLEPGWRRFSVRPVPGGGITWAQSELESVSGLIRVHWELRDGEIVVEVTVPPRSTAEICLPASDPVDVGPGVHTLRAAYAGTTGKELP